MQTHAWENQPLQDLQAQEKIRSENPQNYRLCKIKMRTKRKASFYKFLFITPFCPRRNFTSTILMQRLEKFFPMESNPHMFIPHNKKKKRKEKLEPTIQNVWAYLTVMFIQVEEQGISTVWIDRELLITSLTTFQE